MMTSVPNRIDFCRQSYQSYGPIKVANEFRINDHCFSLQMLLAGRTPLTQKFSFSLYLWSSFTQWHPSVTTKIFVDINPFFWFRTQLRLNWLFCANAMALLLPQISLCKKRIIHQIHMKVWTCKIKELLLHGTCM